MNIGAVVLAAGFSNRFGSLKIRARLNNGQTVLQQTMANIQQSIPNPLVVTRPDIYPQIADDCLDVRVFDDAEKGMGATLAYAMGQILESNEWDGCLVCLADMPFIKPETYQKVRDALTPDNIVIPFFAGRAGNPAGFGAFFFPSLTSLTGDRGGRSVIQQNPDAVVKLEVEDPAVLQDIDTPDDLRRFDIAE
ncbi:MAG: nucleotidyltransferase family protein [Gammaproteobacteria bacterium]|nr:nucleotidyltransferase family protein [Gammaproteobacteria bacterium]